MSANINAIMRRTGGTGTYALYLQWTGEEVGTTKVLLAAGITSECFLAPGAKGARWTTTTHDSPEAARAHVTTLLAGREDVRAACIELTQQDIGRLRRGVLSTAVYPMSDLITAADAEAG